MNWYVRLNGQTIGPLSESELRKLVGEGVVTPETPVSRDGHNFENASKLLGATFHARPPKTAPPHSSASFPRRRDANPGPRPGDQRRTIIAMIAVAVTVVLLPIILVAMMAFVRGYRSVAEPPVAPVSNEPQVSEEYLIQQRQAQRTLEFWNALRVAGGEVAACTDDDPSVMSDALRECATRIAALPTADVDPDAVQCGVDFAIVLQNMADHIQRSNDPTMLIESFIRGAAGDPFGTSAELMEAQSDIVKQLQHVREQAVRTRAVLSSRYGVEFPPL